MRLATFNVENMFERPKAMNLKKPSEGKPILEDFVKLNDLIERAVYTASVKSQLLTLMGKHSGLLSQGKSKYVCLREKSQKLVRKPKNKPYEIAVNGRAEWIGWFELVTDTIDEVALENTARIIGAVDADVLCVVEADSRPALVHFNETVMGKVNAAPYSHVMLVDGNDERGIDVGLLTRSDFAIESIVSHVDDRDPTGVVFSRDCAEYSVRLPTGESLLVLVNHLKSKGHGTPASSNAKRKRQAERIRQVYEQRLAAGARLVAVAGDFNDTPASEPLSPLLQNGSNLVDVMAHAAFQGDGRKGTYLNGSDSQKLDYILLSPALAARVDSGGIERRGVWGGEHGTLFPHLPEITKEIESASDHAALFVDFH